MKNAKWRWGREANNAIAVCEYTVQHSEHQLFQQAKLALLVTWYLR